MLVTTKPTTATSLVNDSPISRVFIAQDQGPNDSWGAEYDMRGTITTPIHPLPLSKVTKETPAFSDLGLSHKTFTIHMFAANKTYNHNRAVRKNPLHGQWPSSGKETFVSAALQRSIPSGAMAPALRDWHTANQLSRDSTSFADGAEGASAVLLGKRRHSSHEPFVMERIRARLNAKKLHPVMQSLATFAAYNTRDERPDLNAQTGAPTSNPGPESTSKEGDSWTVGWRRSHWRSVDSNASEEISSDFNLTQPNEENPKE